MSIPGSQRALSRSENLLLCPLRQQREQRHPDPESILRARRVVFVIAQPLDQRLSSRRRDRILLLVLSARAGDGLLADPPLIRKPPQQRIHQVVMNGPLAEDHPRLLL